MCGHKFNLKIDESTKLLDTRIFDSYDTNELLLLSILLNNHALNFYSVLILSAALIVGSVHIVKSWKKQ